MPEPEAGGVALPQLIERLQHGAERAVAELSQDELEAIIDDLTFALESDVIRDLLSKIVARIDRQKHRTFRRIVEIARQDDDRTPVLLAALKHLGFSGEPTDEEFAWLVHVMSTNGNAMARLDAFDQSLRLALQPALQAILEAVATIHPDEAIRAQMATSKGEVLGGNGDTGGLLTADELAGEIAASLGDDMDAPPAMPGGDAFLAAYPDAGPETEPAQPEMPEPHSEDAAAWAQYEEPQPARLTVRTLLRSVDAEGPIGADAPERTEEPPPLPEPAPLPPPEISASAPEPLAEGFADHEFDAFDASMAVERTNPGIVMPPIGDDEVTPLPPPDPAPAIEASASPAPGDDPGAWSAGAEETQPDRLTVRTLLRSIDPGAQLGPGGAVVSSEPEAPAPEPVAIEPVPAASNGANGSSTETVEGMLRNLETVKLTLRQVETSKTVVEETAPLGPDRVPPPAATAPAKPPAPKYAALDLAPLNAPERARVLQKTRRELAAEERRGYLSWLLERENDASFGAAIRREILEFAFERPTYLAFDAGTRAKLGRWIRERAAGDQLAPAAILAALRRSTWADGEPPTIDGETRPVVDAATGVLGRVPSEERLALLTRDFTAWLFAVREFEDKEVLDRWTRDEHPGVSEGIFRSLAAMDASTSKLGVTEGPTAIELALGLWDRCEPEKRAAMATAIAAGWSRGFVLDRVRFFAGFWKRYRENPSQRESILVALASFDKEIEDARRKEPEIDGAPAAAADASGFAQPPESPELAQPSVAPTPASTPVKEDSAPTEAKVLASLVGQKKIGPAAATPVATPATPAVAPPRTPTSAGVPPAPVQADEVTAPDGADERYYERQKRELERVMKQMKDSTPTPTAKKVETPRGGTAVPPAMPPSRTPTSPSTIARAPVKPPPPVVEEAEDDVVPDEGDAVLTEEERANSGPKKLPVAKPQPVGPTPPMTVAPPLASSVPRTTPRPAAPIAPAAPASPTGKPGDDDIVLPNESLRTLSEYTGFLRSLSGGTSIDELLGRHGMDYRQYAACMTAWGKLLQTRPDLALRMGQLLRGG